METLISQLCKEVKSVGRDTNAQELIDTISWDKISCVVVYDEDKQVIGVITEKDMVFAESLGIKKRDIKSWQICSRDIINIGPEDTILGAATLMIENKVHHVLVMTGDYVEGVVTSLDILKEMLESR
ncbi:MAG TPA: CBS domain-containing protein [Gammaproteobacteria bacterium]|nr:CBS domain-containing protein [Gammaproteobacteria bacterium]